ncbi:MAG: hypothetical protein M3P96_05525, partial [Actinomycetota bacterium]|nr:hypothetical protein [Actinomycetota bacterium]
MTAGVEARALTAVGRTRALGLHFYGHLLGVAGEPPAAGRALLRLDAWDPPDDPDMSDVRPSTGALATLADLALGAAIRTHVEPGALLATATLSLQLAVGAALDQPRGELSAEAVALPVTAGQGTAHAVLRAGATPIGSAQAWFIAVAPAAGRPPTMPSLMPWEHHDPPPVRVPPPGELDEREASAVRAAVAAGRRTAA